jgi:putative ABC transport system permease protein
MRIALPTLKYPKGEEQSRFFHQTLDRVVALPGVESAGLTAGPPFTTYGFEWPFTTDDHPDVDELSRTAASSISPNYFRTMGIPVIYGRDFTEYDVATAPSVIIINQTFARRFFPNQNPLGKRIRVVSDRWLTVIGMTGDVQIFMYCFNIFGGMPPSWELTRTGSACGLAPAMFRMRYQF